MFKIKEINIPIDIISKYRTELMGVAIIMIMICHNRIVVDNGFISECNEFFKSICQCGVDIFLLLSGLGCYYSYSKNSNTLSFYKRRILRILPTYLLIMVSYWVVLFLIKSQSFEGIWQYVYYNNLISFFSMGNTGSWYISAILVLYLVTPFMYRILCKNSEVLFAVIIINIIISFLIPSIVVQRNILTVNRLFITRIPSFMIGMMLGKMIKSKNKAVNISVNILVPILLIIMFLLWVNYKYNVSCSVIVQYNLFALLSVGISYLIAYALEKFNRRMAVKKVLSFMGLITLEIYLMHEKFIFIISTVIESKFFNIYVILGTHAVSIIINVLAIIFAILISYIVNGLVSRFIFKRKKS